MSSTSLRPYLGVTPRLGTNVYVDPAAVVIGDVVIGDDSSIWPCAVARGDVHYVRIGARTNIQDGAVLHVTHDGEYTPGGFPLIIGDDVTVGHGAIVHACTVKDACLIGMNATVLDGAVVETGAMVAAGAVVTPRKIVRKGELWAGNPGRKLRDLTEKDYENFKRVVEGYVRLSRTYGPDVEVRQAAE